MEKKKYVAVLSATALAALFATTTYAPTVKAADGDVYDLATKTVKYSKTQYMGDTSVYKQAVQDTTNNQAAYGIEESSSVYSIKKLNDNIGTKMQQPGAVLLDVIKAMTVGVTPEVITPATTGLTVSSVSAITDKDVTVSFAATTAAMTGVTINVKDNTGATVAVKPVDLVSGETTATFTFVNAFTVAPTGVWNVAGVSVDLDLQTNLDSVYDAANQVTLLAAFNKLGLTDVNSANIAFYQTALTTVKTTVAKADFTKVIAQKVIADGNTAALAGVNETAVVKAVNDATTQVDLLAALQNAAFTAVNPDWIADYESTIGGANVNTTIKLTQGLIDAQNKIHVDATVAALNLDTDATASVVVKDLNAARTMVSAYMVPDVAGVNTKAETLRKIDVQLAIANVLSATTPAELSVAMNALHASDLAFELDMDNYKDANRAAYITKLTDAVTAVAAKNTIKEINGLLVTVNAEQTALAPTAVKTAGNFTVAAPTDVQTANLLKALKAYTDVKYVADANASSYATLADASVTTANAFGQILIANVADTDAATVQTLVNEANLAAIQSATTADTVYAALVAYGNDIKDLSVNNEAQYLIDKVNFTTNPTTVQLKVDAANIEALQAQTNATGVLAKLQIMTQVKNVKAENAKAYLAGVLDTTTSGSLGNATTTTIANVQTAIDAINTTTVATTSLKALNDATTASATENALTTIAIADATNFPEYINLSSADKLIVAGLFMNNDVFTTSGLVTAPRTGSVEFGKYTSTASAGDVDTDLTALVNKVNGLTTAINGVFAGTPTIVTVQTELGKLVGAGYTAYDSLSATDKLKVAESFIAGYPTKDGAFIANSYKSLSAYEAAVDAAIAAK